MPKQGRSIHRRKYSISVASGDTGASQEIKNINGEASVSFGIPELDGASKARLKIVDKDGPPILNTGYLDHIDGEVAWWTDPSGILLGGNLANIGYSTAEIACGTAQSAPRDFTIILRIQTKG